MEKIVLEVGAEGGALRIVAMQAGDDWVYRAEKTSDAWLLDEEGPPPPQKTPQNPWVTLDAAFEQLDTYPWVQLYPLYVAPEWRFDVQVAVKRRSGNADYIDWHTWDRVLSTDGKKDHMF